MNKTFCILEQGSSVNDPETIKKKEMFSTSFSSFYRLNWKTDSDPNANFFAPKTVWSEGRSTLFDQVSKEYDYYIFTDDDASFSTQSPNGVAEEIKRVLEHYKPLAGTFFISSKKGGWFFDVDLQHNDCKDKEAFLIAGFDLCVHIFHRSFAEVMFPVIHHGSGKCMWYAHWACHTLFPQKQMCFTNVFYENTRADPHENEKTLNILNQTK